MIQYLKQTDLRFLAIEMNRFSLKTTVTVITLRAQSIGLLGVDSHQKKLKKWSFFGRKMCFEKSCLRRQENFYPTLRF